MLGGNSEPRIWTPVFKSANFLRIAVAGSSIVMALTIDRSSAALLKHN
jgi:hypothetical protein